MFKNGLVFRSYYEFICRFYFEYQKALDESAKMTESSNSAEVTTTVNNKKTM